MLNSTKISTPKMQQSKALCEKNRVAELFDLVISLFAFWGAWLGLLIAGLITWAMSGFLGSEFHAGLFIGLSVPLVSICVYVQYIKEKRDLPGNRE